MADISLIIPLDGSQAQFLSMCESLASTEDEIAQIVVVRPSWTEVGEEDLEALPREPLVVECDGTLGELWNAGIAASTTEYVYPASCRIRFAKAFYHVCTAQVTRDPVDLLFFHLQEFDLAEQAYTSKRWSMRLGLPAEPFAPAEHPYRIIQRLNANPCAAVFSRRFLDAQEFSFRSVASFDDDPALPALIAEAETISRLPWALAVLAYDSTTIFDEVDHDVFMVRYGIFADVYADGLPLGPTSDSILEWAVAFASRNIDNAPDELAERMLDEIGETILPIIGENLEHRDDTLLLEGAEPLLLSTLSRRELVDVVRELRTAGGELRYRSEMLELMLKRTRAGNTGTTRPKKRGLFRR